MSLPASPRRTLADIERLERVPLTKRLAVGSTYALLQKTVASNPEQPARCFLPVGDPFQPGEALTARAFLGKVHQSANLLADLGMGPAGGLQDALRSVGVPARESERSHPGHAPRLGAS